MPLARYLLKAPPEAFEHWKRAAATEGIPMAAWIRRELEQAYDLAVARGEVEPDRPIDQAG